MWPDYAQLRARRRFPGRRGNVVAAMVVALTTVDGPAFAQSRDSDLFAPFAALPGDASSPLRDQRLDPRDRVFGIIIGGEPRAYPLADLEKAEAEVHDSVAGSAVDVALRETGPVVLSAAAPVAEKRTCEWQAWVEAHGDTSLWRPAAVPEAHAVRPLRDVRVTESHDYTAAMASAFASSRMASNNLAAYGFVVISGTVENVAKEPVHHVVLRYELLDATGKVVYREEGFNRSAEALAGSKLEAGDVVTPISPGGRDSFRMLLIPEDLPRFETARVAVLRVY